MCVYNCHNLAFTLSEKLIIYYIQKFCSFLIGVQSDLDTMGEHHKLGLWLPNDMTA